MGGGGQREREREKLDKWMDWIRKITAKQTNKEKEKVK